MDKDSKSNEMRNVVITYCTEWGFLTRASSLAATTKSKCGLIAILKEGHNAIFEVSLNDEVIYTNNKACGTFPQEDEIVQKIAQYKATGWVHKKPSKP